MSKRLRIAIADDEQDMRDYFREILPDLGHEVVAVARTGVELVEQCRRLKPDLVITDIKMPDMDGIEAAEQLAGADAVPVVLVSAYHDKDLVERATADHVFGYLVKPIKQADLAPTISVAMRRFEQFRELQKESADLRQALADRKVIERAKGILMKAVGMEEEAAFRRLQKLASQKNQRLVEIARAIVTANEAFEQPNDD